MDNQSTTASFGYWVKRRRLALDLTQAALAQKVGCATVTIKKIEYDERRPSAQMAALLADSLAVPADERERFIVAALGEQPVDRLPLSQEPVRSRPSWMDGHDGPAQRTMPFVGREDELVRLRACLQLALAGKGAVQFVVGEAGRGKTALLAEFARGATAASTDLIVAWGSCTAAGAGDPYLPFRDLLLGLAGEAERDWRSGRLSQEQARRLWDFAPEVAETMWSTGPQLVDSFVPAALLQRGLAAARRVGTAPAGAAGEQQSYLFAQITDVLEKLARQRPLLFLLDDLQWADSASRHLLFHLGRRLQSSRVLIAGAYRPVETKSAADTDDLLLSDVVHELARRSGDIVINLDQFDLPLGRRFVDGLLDSEPNCLDEDFRVRFFWRTRGHPLFTVELLREMRARGSLIQDADGAWGASEAIDWDTMPARVEAVIAQRIARLPTNLRELLTTASVEGDSFTAQVIAAVQELDERQALRQLAQLQEQGLVREESELSSKGGWLARYQFSHILFQQFLYQQLGQAERRLVHGAIAAALERFYQLGDDSGLHVAEGTLLSQLAQHFAAAGEDTKAAVYLEQLGDRARTLYAEREAVAHYERALALLRSEERAPGSAVALGRLHIKLGLAYQTGFDYQQAQEAFDEAFSVLPGRRSAPLLAPSPHPLRLLWQDPPSLDPTLGGYNLTAPVAGQLFSGLVSFGPDNEILPDVADRWEISRDGRHYLFHLRDDVVWSDDTPVTAHDFAFTYRRALDPATGAHVAGQLLYAVQGAQGYHTGEHDRPECLGIQAVDDHTLAFELVEPTSYFIYNLAYYVLLPVPQHAVQLHGDEWATPGRIVTNGPFQLAAWEPGKQMLLARNPRYHGSFGGNLEQVHLTLDQPASAQPILYTAGELDVASNWFGTAGEMAHLAERFPAESVTRASFVTWEYFVDVTRPPLDNKNVRRALVMALDRKALAEGPLGGTVTAATGGFVPPGMPGHLPGCALPYDPGEARRLLAASGYSQGAPFIIAYYPGRDLQAQFLQQSWQQELGVTIQLEEVTPGRFSAILSRPEPLLFVGLWWADYPDPDNFLRVEIELAVPEWEHQGYYQLLAEAARTTNQQERLRLYQGAEDILAEEAVLVPLYYQPFHLMLKPWVKHFPTAAIKHPGFWKDVIIERDGRS